MGAPPQLEPGFQGLRRQGDSDPLVEGRREKFGSVVLHVIPGEISHAEFGGVAPTNG